MGLIYKDKKSKNVFVDLGVVVILLVALMVSMVLVNSVTSFNSKAAGKPGGGGGCAPGSQQYRNVTCLNRQGGTFTLLQTRTCSSSRTWGSWSPSCPVY